MVSVALRASPRFSETVMRTVPGPELLVADVTVKNDPLDVTLHAQPLLVVTPIEAVPPTPAMLSVELPSEYEQAAAAGGGVGVGDEGELEHAATTATEPITHADQSRRTEPPDRG